MQAARDLSSSDRSADATYTNFSDSTSDDEAKPPRTPSLDTEPPATTNSHHRGVACVADSQPHLALTSSSNLSNVRPAPIPHNTPGGYSVSACRQLLLQSPGEFYALICVGMPSDDAREFLRRLIDTGDWIEPITALLNDLHCRESEAGNSQKYMDMLLEVLTDDERRLLRDDWIDKLVNRSRCQEALVRPGQRDTAERIAYLCFRQDEAASAARALVASCSSGADARRAQAIQLLKGSMYHMDHLEQRPHSGRLVKALLEELHRSYDGHFVENVLLPAIASETIPCDALADCVPLVRGDLEAQLVIATYCVDALVGWLADLDLSEQPAGTADTIARHLCELHRGDSPDYWAVLVSTLVDRNVPVNTGLLRHMTTAQFRALFSASSPFPDRDRLRLFADVDVTDPAFRAAVDAIADKPELFEFITRSRFPFQEVWAGKPHNTLCDLMLPLWLQKQALTVRERERQFALQQVPPALLGLAASHWLLTWVVSRHLRFLSDDQLRAVVQTFHPLHASEIRMKAIDELPDARHRIVLREGADHIIRDFFVWKSRDVTRRAGVLEDELETLRQTVRTDRGLAPANRTFKSYEEAMDASRAIWSAGTALNRGLRLTLLEQRVEALADDDSELVRTKGSLAASKAAFSDLREACLNDGGLEAEIAEVYPTAEPSPAERFNLPAAVTAHLKADLSTPLGLRSWRTLADVGIIDERDLAVLGISEADARELTAIEEGVAAALQGAVLEHGIRPDFAIEFANLISIDIEQTQASFVHYFHEAIATCRAAASITLAAQAEEEPEEFLDAYCSGRGICRDDVWVELSDEDRNSLGDQIFKPRHRYNALFNHRDPRFVTLLAAAVTHLAIESAERALADPVRDLKARIERYCAAHNTSLPMTLRQVHSDLHPARVTAAATALSSDGYDSQVLSDVILCLHFLREHGIRRRLQHYTLQELIPVGSFIPWVPKLDAARMRHLGRESVITRRLRRRWRVLAEQGITSLSQFVTTHADARVDAVAAYRIADHVPVTQGDSAESGSDAGGSDEDDTGIELSDFADELENSDYAGIDLGDIAALAEQNRRGWQAASASDGSD